MFGPTHANRQPEKDYSPHFSSLENQLNGLNITLSQLVTSLTKTAKDRKIAHYNLTTEKVAWDSYGYHYFGIITDSTQTITIEQYGKTYSRVLNPGFNPLNLGDAATLAAVQPFQASFLWTDYIPLESASNLDPATGSLNINFANATKMAPVDVQGAGLKITAPIMITPNGNAPSLVGKAAGEISYAAVNGSVTDWSGWAKQVWAVNNNHPIPVDIFLQQSTRGMDYWRPDAKTELDTLTLTAGTTAGGTVNITLNGVLTALTLAATDTTPALAATKIRAASYAGWTTGGTGAVVTFTKNVPGVCSAPVYDPTTTAAAGSFAVTTAGNDPRYMVTVPAYNNVIVTPDHFPILGQTLVEPTIVAIKHTQAVGPASGWLSISTYPVPIV